MCFRSCDICDDTKQHSAMSGSKITYRHTLSSITHTHRAVCSLVKLHKHWISVYVITCDGSPLSNTHCHQSQTHIHKHIHAHIHYQPKKWSPLLTIFLLLYLIDCLFNIFLFPYIFFFCHDLRPFCNFTVNISLVFLSFILINFTFSLFFFFPPPLLRSLFLSLSSPLPFLCGVAVGGMAGRRGSPEGILGAEVPVIHYPACFSLWQPCDRVLLRALTHTHTHSCIWSALRLHSKSAGHTHHTVSQTASGFTCT